ncbi:THO complex subunit 3-like [Chondrus crispus]|uniref:THO complex subunit 3-like n=1 Tax=Chondrus crispus TaxID=2769 RepID=R7QBY0_CHOCR|nr:THO complex subunit 3-like [Chondrus crispus]CDF35308.1 THO complex subunit 3-like [Chondrus crispus]|eukprot:XP_005715126.1 THO complex subunit 3-like [Chondrus crispus]
MHPFVSLETKHFLGHRKVVSAVTWNLDGTRLAAAGDNTGLLIWDAEHIEANARPERRVLHECRGHSKNIEVVLSSPTSPYMYATAGLDNLVNIFDIRADTRPSASITTDSKCLFGEWAPDGNSIAIGTDTNNLYVVDCLSMKISKKFPFEKDFNQFRWSVDGKRMYLTRGDGSVDVDEWPSMKPLTSMRGHARACVGIACDPKSRFIAVTSMDTCVSIWDALSVTNIFTIDRWEVPVQQAEYSHDGQYLALLGECQHIDITESTTGGLRYSIPTGAKVNDMAWHPSQNLLAYAPLPPRYPPADYQPAVCVWGLARA